MTIDQARAEVQRRFCSPLSRAAVWITPSGRRAVGLIDGGARYLLGVGETWEEAIGSVQKRQGGANNAKKKNRMDARPNAPEASGDR